MKNIIRTTLCMLLFPTLVKSQELAPFTSDGCSVFPDGNLQNQSLWINCCIQHDFAYWKGGTYSERLAADKKLEACVAELGQPEIAEIMLMGVRMGGSPYFPVHYRWGYGWPYLRGYKSLSTEEKQQVKSKLQQSIKMLQQFAKEIN